jgi:hypothetical protein
MKIGNDRSINWERQEDKRGRDPLLSKSDDNRDSLKSSPPTADLIIISNRI